MVFKRKKQKEQEEKVIPQPEAQPRPASVEENTSAAQPSPPPETAAEVENDVTAEGFSIPQPEAESHAAATPSQPPSPSQPEKPPKKKPGFFHKVWRTVLVALVLFGLGFVTAAWFLYRPAHQKASAVPALQAKLADEQSKVATLKKQVESLQAEIQSQQDTVKQAKMRVAFAEALKSAYAARLALAENDATGANIQIAALEKALHTLQDTVPDAQKSTIGDLLSQVADIRSKLDSPAYADRQLKALIAHLQALGDLIANP